MSIDEAHLRELREALSRPGTVPPAEGRPVTVTDVRLSPGGERDELIVTYSVPDTPPGTCPIPYGPSWRLMWESDDPAHPVARLAEEVQLWAIGHVRKHHPPEPLDRDLVRRELPTVDELWQELIAHFSDVRPTPGGFVGTAYGETTTVVLTPDRWQDHVVSCEIGSRMDYGVDANRPGDGLFVALEGLDETLATMDDDESFVVLTGSGFRASTRAELPPRRGRAAERESAEMMRRIAEARTENPDARFGWSANHPDATRSRNEDDD